jgi:hypothetical protein
VAALAFTTSKARIGRIVGTRRHEASVESASVRRRRGGDAASTIGAVFQQVLEAVEGAKAALVRAVPSPRGVPGPLAESLQAFERGLRDAMEGMDGWRTPETERVWRSCRDGLSEALRRAERLRLEAPPLDYESLVAVLGELIAPLDSFEVAERQLGR